MSATTRRLRFLRWQQCLQALTAYNSSELPNPKTVIIDTLTDTEPEKLQGLKHGVVFTPGAMLELARMGQP